MQDTKNLPRNDVICLDAKSFYASVECVSRGLDPMTTHLAVVGSLDRSGSIVLSASPRMKTDYKIKTGSRHFEIPKLPHIHIVEARMGHYLKISMHMFEILKRFAPIEAIFTYSVDEAFVTTKGLGSLYGDVRSIARRLQQSIKMELSIPTACGIGDNHVQSKLALDVLGKKDAASGYIASVSYEDFAEKLWKTPIKDIWGIANRMEKNLHKMGIYVLGDIANYSLERLRKRFGVMGDQLFNHAWGIDLTEPFYKPELNKYHAIAQKGFSSGITLLRGYSGDETYVVILEQVEEIARRARSVKMAGRTISLSVGYSHDDGGGGFSHSHTIDIATNVTMKIYDVCKSLFERYYAGRVVRMVHVSLTNLQQDEVVQLDLFENNEKQRDLGYAMDAIRRKHGSSSLFRASSLTPAGTALHRATTIGGHKA